MLVLKVLIRKSRAVYRHLTRPIVFDKVATLDHKVFDDTKEGGTFITDRLLILQEFTGAELSKVLAGLGALWSDRGEMDATPTGRNVKVEPYIGSKEFQLDASQIDSVFSFAHGNVKEDNDVASFNGVHDKGIGSVGHGRDWLFLVCVQKVKVGGFE